jgi:hypothetical protein
VGISTQARDREERSSQQFRINNIGRRLAIRAENKDVIHTHIISTTKKKTLTLCACNRKAKKKNLNKMGLLTCSYIKNLNLYVCSRFFFFFFVILDSILNLTKVQFHGLNLVPIQKKKKYIF